MPKGWGLESLFIGPPTPTVPTTVRVAPQVGASFAKTCSHSHLFTLKAKRRHGYKLLVIPKDRRLGPTIYKESWLLHEREASPYPGRRYFQKYVDETAKKEVKDIFGGGRGYGDVPEPSRKRAPLGLDAEGVLFIFVIVLLIVDRKSVV